MPASPATPRRSSTNRKSGPVIPIRHDGISSKPLDLSDCNSVRDRIRQWQEQGAKMVSSPVLSDISVTGNENANVDVPFSPSPSPSPREKKFVRGADTTPRRKSSRWVDPDKREWIRESRSSSTPRKRLVSDEHWKKKQRRSPRSGQLPPKQESKGQPKQEKPCSEAPRHTSSRIEREGRQRRKKARSSAEGSTSLDGGAEMEADETPPVPERGSGNHDRVVQSHVDKGVGDDFARSLRSISPPMHSVKKPGNSFPVSAQTDEQPVRRSHYAETLGKSPETVQRSFGRAPGSVRSRKSSIISQAKEMFTRNEAVHPATQRLPSIEAWLEEQPDPFVDTSPERVEIPAPLKTRSKRRKAAVIPEKFEDPNKIWNHIESEDQQLDAVTSNGRRRRRRSHKYQDATDLVSPESEGATRLTEKTPRTSPTSQDRVSAPTEVASSGLKRRGAKALRARTGSSPSKRRIPESNFDNIGRDSMLPATFEEESATSAKEQLRHVRPCPRTGIHPLSTIASVETFQSQVEVENGDDMLARDSNGLQRRLTTHEDLMSVLSLPGAGGSIRSARSTPTAKELNSTATLDELFKELEMDEARYMRELTTLVDGVIPVLLQCVLSKTDSAAAAGLFSSSGSARDDLNFTKPIVDMGIALERLKTLHKRIPTQDLNSLLSWSQTAHKVYIEYLKAWRLGFQDVVVNLAPSDTSTHRDMDRGMAQDEHGDVVDDDGRKVDVAYLLKRPLVGAKRLRNMLRRVQTIYPSSRALRAANDFEDLLKTARMRSNEEKSRLEDEAAANIDPTKARDVRTLRALSGVKIDRSRSVKARDFFSLTIYHSNGQQLDCQTELLYRQNQPGLPESGDLLICEVSNSGKWLLFPPQETRLISARPGDNDGEIVIMVRGSSSLVGAWYELLLLKTTDIEAASEWIDMLPKNPLPPKLQRNSSFNHRQIEGHTSLQQDTTAGEERLPLFSRSPDPNPVEVPIGEPSVVGLVEFGTPRAAPGTSDHQDPIPPQPLTTSRGHVLPQTPVIKETQTLPGNSHTSLNPEQTSSPHTSSHDGSSPTLRRRKPATRRQARRRESSPSSPLATSSTLLLGRPSHATNTRKISRTDDDSKEWISSSDLRRAASAEREENEPAQYAQLSPRSRPQRPEYHRALSSTPSRELPTVHRLRPSSPASTPLTDSIEDQWSTTSGETKKSKQGEDSAKAHSTKETASRQLSPPGTLFSDHIPSPPPHRSRSKSPLSRARAEARQVHPLHRSSPHQEQGKLVPTLKTQQQPLSRPGRRDDRRSSSPLKHEYAPSTPSLSGESGDESIDSSCLETSDDEALEEADQATPLVNIDTAATRRPMRVSPPSSLPNLPAGTLAPSNSASQAPYRTVPHILETDAQPFRTIATLWSWTQEGGWQKLYPDECSIVVSPGLIEGYEMSAAHSAPRVVSDNATESEELSGAESDHHGTRPLIAYELTPAITLYRGTGIDISIRSIPTERSKFNKSQHIMFRSRNPQECEGLHTMMNQSRMDNPTWMALQRARAEQGADVNTDTTPAPARHSRASFRSGSWFGFGNRGRKSSYRASSAPEAGSQSVANASETTVASMNSAFSALRRFSGGSNGGRGLFNLNRSSVVRRNRRFGPANLASLHSSSSSTTRTGDSTSGATTAAPSGTINNVKIRLYVRNSAASAWIDMGAAKLSVMPAPLPPSAANPSQLPNMATYDPSPLGTADGPHPPSTFITGQPSQARVEPRLPSSSHTPHRLHGNGEENRILVTGKTKGEILLDAVLHESCFERVARLGIAFNVWEEHEEVGKSGGVVGGKGRTYMMVMKGEAAAAWVFGMVGKLRY